MFEDIEKELVKANITDAVINKLRADYIVLVVKDKTDRVGFEIVNSARKEVKRVRVSITKFLKDLRTPAFDFQKAVVAKEKDIVSRLDEIETYLGSQEEIYNPKLVEEVKVLTDEEKLTVYANQILKIDLPIMEKKENLEKLEKFSEKLVKLVKTIK